MSARVEKEVQNSNREVSVTYLNAVEFHRYMKRTDYHQRILKDSGEEEIAEEYFAVEIADSERRSSVSGAVLVSAFVPKIMPMDSSQRSIF